MNLLSLMGTCAMLVVGRSDSALNFLVEQNGECSYTVMFPRKVQENDWFGCYAANLVTTYSPRHFDYLADKFGWSCRFTMVAHKGDTVAVAVYLRAMKD